MKFSLTNKFKERFYDAIKFKDEKFIFNSLYEISPADITILLNEFNSADSKYVLDIIDLSISSKIISELDQDTRISFLKVFSAQEIAKYIEKMDSDDGADILSDLDLEFRNSVIKYIKDKEKSSNLKDLIRYDDNVAGGLMAKELVRCNINWNIVQCINQIRKQAEEVSKLYSVYVTDNYGKLIGKVSLKKIIISKDKTKIKEIYDDYVISVDTSTKAEEVVIIMQKYDLDALPVVNKRGKLVGRITIDDVVDYITESADEERQIMSGISSDVEEDDSIWKLSSARLPRFCIRSFEFVSTFNIIQDNWELSNFDINTDYNSAHVTLNNKGEFIVKTPDGNVKMEFEWLESAYLIKENDELKFKFYFSDTVSESVTPL